MPQDLPDEPSRVNASAGEIGVRSPAQGDASGELPHIPDHALLRRIGEGSYGEVWLARNVMGTLRAVKIVHRASFDHDRPYEREYAGIQKFEPVSRNHNGFVDILQIGRDDEAGYFYYVMELADGANSSTPVAADVRRLTSKSEPGNPPSEIDRSLLVSAATYRARTLRSLLHPCRSVRFAPSSPQLRRPIVGNWFSQCSRFTRRPPPAGGRRSPSSNRSDPRESCNKAEKSIGSWSVVGSP